jgi:hypothetical protein
MREAIMSMHHLSFPQARVVRDVAAPAEGWAEAQPALKEWRGRMRRIWRHELFLVAPFTEGHAHVHART